MPRISRNWLKSYVNHTRFSESPDSFHFWTGVATIAGALRRRVWIDQRHFQWTPNFYIILVGPPGVAAKSTSIRSGLSLLERVPGIYFGPQSLTWQALTEALQNAQEHVELKDKAEPEVMSCLTIGVSELGTFLRPDNSEFMDVLIAMWDGQKEVWRRQTRTQGATVIHNPWLNVIGCTTPAWLKQNFPDVLIGGGLTSRMVFVFADTKRQLVAYPGDLIPGKDWENEETELVADLCAIAELCGEYTFTKEAKKWGIEWYERHWTTDRPLNMASDRFSGYTARKQTHLHKLAMVLAAAKRNELVIDIEDLIEADAALGVLEIDMQKVFNAISVGEAEVRTAEEILHLIRSHKEIPYQQLWKQCFTLMALQEFINGIKSNIEAGHIKVFTKEGAKWLGYVGRDGD